MIIPLVSKAQPVDQDQSETQRPRELKHFRYMLGATSKRRSNARRNESRLLKPTEAATEPIVSSGSRSRRLASSSRIRSTKVAGVIPNLVLNLLLKCLAHRHALAANFSIDKSLRR